MSENEIQETDKNSTAYQEKKWSKVNFWSCLVAVIVAGLDLILSIVTQYSKIDVWVVICLVIAITVIGMAAVIVMIVSWYKLRKLKKQSAPENDDN